MLFLSGFIFGVLFNSMPILYLTDDGIVYRESMFDLKLKTIPFNCVCSVSIDTYLNPKGIVHILCLSTSDRGLVEINTYFCTESASKIREAILKCLTHPDVSN